MARSISVKINTADVISMIENKIAEYEKQIADYPQAKAQYEIDRMNWAKQVGSRAIEIIASGNHFDHEDWSQRISIDKNYRNINISIGNELVGELAVMYEVPSRKDVEKVVITPAVVRKEEEPTYVPRSIGSAKRTKGEKSDKNSEEKSA